MSLKFNSMLMVMALVVLALTGWTDVARAEVKLPALFGDNCVLQRGIPVPVWGTGDAGEAVSVSICGQKAEAATDANGHWMVKLAALAAGGPFEMTITGKNTIVLKNVAVGEVWIASGQSNMEYPLKSWSPPESEYGKKALKDVAEANDPMLRMFAVTKKTADKPQDNVTSVKGQWDVTTPQTAAGGGFTAVGYFFARELRAKLNVPVGIIHSSWGGTPAEAWTSREALEADPELKGIYDAWEKRIASYSELKKVYDEKTLPDWKTAVDKAKADGKPAPRKPDGPADPNNPHRAATLYNGMIAPLIPYSIAGTVWYQGESNAGNGKQYRKLFPAMIQDWRTRWALVDFPFFFVQLANFQKRQTVPNEGGWAQLREAQTMTLALPHTGMAVAIDLADADNPGDIHPHNKRDVGVRLALNALATVYDQKVEYAGPLFKEAMFEGNEARLSFTHADGLAAHGDKLEGFAIAGADHKFVWGEAKIVGETVVVTSEKVPQPTVVRYAWAINPLGNLYNKSNLPASPFRTDPESPQ